MTSAHRPIIFDCDGVLVDSEIIYVAIELELLKDLGLTYDITDYKARFMGMHDRDFLSALAQDYETRIGGDFPESFHTDLQQRSAAKMATDLMAISGIHELLACHETPHAVASSSAQEELHWKLGKTELKTYFGPHIYSGDQVKKGKPAPDLFLLAADRLGVAPTDCIVIEDSRNGVKGGVAAGMEVWGFTGGAHAYDGLEERLLEAGAKRVFNSHAAIQAAL